MSVDDENHLPQFLFDTGWGDGRPDLGENDLGSLIQLQLAPDRSGGWPGPGVDGLSAANVVSKTS
jgi:hypothetical protein